MNPFNRLLISKLVFVGITSFVSAMNIEQLDKMLDVEMQRNKQVRELSSPEIEKRVALKKMLKRFNIKEFAETKGYGYKTANLRQLKEIEKNFFGSVKVPEFIAISSESVKLFLLDRGINLEERWKEVCQGVDQDSVRKAKEFPKDFLTKLAQLEQDIKEAFRNPISNLKKDFHISPESEYPEPDRWLLGQKNERLMVRSTGREDTEEVANAGGNESVKNVEPIVQAVLEATGTVVSSYFGEKSFSQRLDIGDPKLFDEPITPVLLQVMIGEKENASAAEIPSAGVMFTEEAEGGFAQKRADSHSPETTGITFIQALFGHNEGLVNGLVPADSYYIGPQFHTHSTIRRKIARITPANNIPVENPQELINKSALPSQVLTKLKRIAIRLEELYGKPMDVEFVYDPIKKTIYLVQARPITYKVTTKPSYLKNLDALRKTTDILSVRTIGSAGGALLYITAYDQFLFDSTLRGACSQFFALPAKSTDHTQDRKKIKCVIVEEMAPATSHEATTFRGAEKPVLYFRDQIKLFNSNMYTSSPMKIVIDTQQEIIVDWSKRPETDLDQLLANAQEAAQGWYTYPIPCQCSLIEMQQVPKFNTIDESIKYLGKEAGDPKPELDELVEKIDRQDSGLVGLHALVDALKTFQKPSAYAVLGLLLMRIREDINSAESNKVPVDLVAQLKGVARFVLSCIPELQAALKNEPGDMRRLYAIRFLEAILFQDADDNIVSGYSYKQIIDTINQEKSIEKKGIVGEYQIQYAKIEPLALTDEVAKKWRACVKKIGDSSGPAAQNLAHLIRELAYFKLLPIWLNTSFAQVRVEGFIDKIDKDVCQIFTIENGKYKRTPFFAQLQKMQDKYASFKPEIFSKAQDFGKNLKFLDNFVSYFKSDAFINDYRLAAPLGKQAAISLLNDVLTAFDESVHNVSGDPSYKTGETTKDYTNLCTILRRYLDFLEWVMKLIPDDLRKSREAAIAKDIRALREPLEQLVRTDEEAFVARGDFDRDFAVVGFSTCGYLVPERYDEVFTTIHSSWENAIRICMYDLAVKEIKLPEWVEKIKDQITGLDQITPLGGEVDGQSVYLYFNLPFPSHGVHIEMTCDLKKKSVEIDCDVAGFQATEPLPAGSTELPKLTVFWKELGDCLDELYRAHEKTGASDSETDYSTEYSTYSSDSETDSSGDNSKYSQYGPSFWFNIKKDTPSNGVDFIGKDIIMLAKYANRDPGAYAMLEKRTQDSSADEIKAKWKARLDIK